MNRPRTRTGKIALAAALAGMMGGALIPTSVKNAAPEVRAQQGDKGTPATNTAPTAPQVAQYHLPRSLAAYYRQSQPVWAARAAPVRACATWNGFAPSSTSAAKPRSPAS